MARKRRGFGRIRQERSGRYSAAYVGPDARLHHAPRTYASEHDAEGWLAGERRKMDLGTWGAVERSDAVTLRAYADKWIEQRSLRPRTRAHYESMLERLILPELGDAKIVTLTPAKVREWHAGLGDSHPTRNAHAYALLHAICATAVQDEVLDANPCRIRAAMQTKRRRDVNILTPTEVNQLAAKMPANLRASVLLAAWCGLRWGETSELRREDVTADCATLRVRRAVTYRSGEFHVGPPKTAAGVVTSPSRRTSAQPSRRTCVTMSGAAATRCCSRMPTAPICAPTFIAPTGRRPGPGSANPTCGYTICAMWVRCWPPNPAPPQPNSCTGSGTPRHRWLCAISMWGRAATPRSRERLSKLAAAAK